LKKFYIFISLSVFVLIIITGYKAISQQTEYVCHPCGADCDLVIYDKEGICSICNMPIIEKERVVFNTMTPEEVAEAVSTGEDYTLLDVRTVAEYEGNAGVAPEKQAGHIIDALNIPHTQLKDRISEIEQYKDRKIIVYCSHSHRSPYSCQILTDLGFNNIYNMTEGLSSWVEKNLKNTKTGESLLIK
jgi:rhodanese-related sulfurtransferase/DNA-directed RNA polymerase subunit RPC12/RpoP